MKYTTQEAQDQERDSLIDALLDGSLELNGDFLDRYAGDLVKGLLLQIPEHERKWALDCAIDPERAYFPGGIASLDPEAIVLSHGEIEIQFDGDPEEYFEDPKEWTIDGDLAYLYTGYGLVIPVDTAKLSEWIEDWKVGQNL